MAGLNLSAIEDLLKESETFFEDDTERVYPIPEQSGPLRHFDNGMRCASRGCASPTYYKVSGIPYCMTHSLRKLNEMLIELGITK